MTDDEKRLDACKQAEAALGENLTWLADQLDLLIRQKNPDVARRMGQMTDAWIKLCRAPGVVTYQRAKDTLAPSKP